MSELLFYKRGRLNCFCLKCHRWGFNTIPYNSSNKTKLRLTGIYHHWHERHPEEWEAFVKHSRERVVSQ